VVVACVASAQWAGAQNAPDQKELDQITARGRALAGYQRAAWTASMQLLATNPDPWTAQRYVAYHADSGWVVAFGRLNADRDTFYVSNIAVPAAVNGQRVDSTYEFHAFDGAPDIDYLVRAARAMDLATMRLGATKRAYSAAAIPDENGDWYVYLTPSADVASVWPLGEDVRYRVSADGQRVLETRQMHAGMVEVTKDGARLVANKTAKPLHDLPEDSDVFHVLVNRSGVSEIVTTKHNQYTIAPDGSITVGKTQRVAGRGL
jgi:hypothetical protein